MSDCNPTLQLRLNSEIESIRQIAPFVEKCCSTCRLDSEAHDDLLLVLTEAVSNSIRHGNRFDPQKVVRVSMVNEDGKVRFEVEDQGAGFDPRNVADPTSAHRLQQAGGRGLYLMRELSHNVQYTKQGRCVCIEFRL